MSTNNVSKIMVDVSDPNDPILKQIAKMNKDAQKDSTFDASGFSDPYGYIPLGETILKVHENLQLKGSTGTGKTYLARVLAHNLGAKYYDVQMTLDTQSFNLVSEVRMHNGSSFVQMAVIVRWLLDPEDSLLYLDEINMTLAGVLSLLHSLADDRRHLYVPDIGMTIPRRKGKYLVIGYNPSEKSEYAGTNAMNIAFIRRFEGFEVEYLSEKEETKILKARGLAHGAASKLTQIAAFSRTAYKAGKLITPITLGNLKAWADLVNAGMPLDDVKRLLYGLYPEKQHGLIDKLWGGEQIV